MRELTRLKYVAELRYGEALAQDARAGGTVPVFGSNGVTGSHNAANTLQPTIIVGRKGSFGKVTWSDIAGHCIDTAFYIDSRTTDENLRWLYWALQTLNLDAHSEDTGVPGLSREKAYQSKLFLPTAAEQTRIADFLDDKTVQIDALIREKERLIESAKNLFEAKLGTAVVQGTVPGNKMIAAAEKGYAAVRSDWDLTPLKHLATWSGGMTPSKDRPDFWVGGIPWISPKDMKIFYIGDGVDHISAQALSETSLRLLPARSVLVVVRGMILAHTFPVAVTTAPLTINQDMKAMRPNESKMSTLYLAWMLRGLQPLMLSLTEESAHGTKVLRTDQWANQCVPVPTLAEQHNLVHSFQEWEAQTSSLVSNTTKTIGLLREYRSSIISAAVCGQMTIS